MEARTAYVAAYVTACMRRGSAWTPWLLEHGLKPSPGQKALENKEKSVLVHPFSHFTKTTDFFLKFSALRAGVVK